MAERHHTTKRKRRPISGKRMDQGAETMRRLKVRALVADAYAQVMDGFSWDVLAPRGHRNASFGGAGVPLAGA